MTLRSRQLLPILTVTAGACLATAAEQRVDFNRDIRPILSNNCIACHAEGGVGIEGLGKPLVGSEFVAGLSDSELVEFLLVGRDTADPLNTTGYLKPPKGGNPSLTNADLALIVQHLRSLDQ